MSTPSGSSRLPSSNRHFPYPYENNQPQSARTPESNPTGFRKNDLRQPPGLENKGPSPSFATLTRMFEAFEQASVQGKTKKSGWKQARLREYFEQYRRDVGPDLYPVVRLILPARDTRRSNFGLKEAKLAQAYVSAMDLLPTSADALKLIGWRTPKADDPVSGDFSIIALSVLNTRPAVVTTNISIDEVNVVLDRLSRVFLTRDNKADPKSKPTAVKDLVGDIIRDLVKTKMTALDNKWFIRIVLKDLKIGCGDRTVLDQVHPDAHHLYNSCSDITRVCWTLVDPDKRLPQDVSTVMPGHVFKPMLSARNNRDLKDIVDLMSTNRIESEATTAEYTHDNEPDCYGPKEFIIEEKLDGNRLQLHKIGDEYKYYSRKAIDYTPSYGASTARGSFTKYIHHLFHPAVEECILDGEMIVWDPLRNAYVPFGTLVSYASVEDKVGEFEPRICFKVFDILHIKGVNGPAQSLLDNTLQDRKKLLRLVFTEEKGRFELVHSVKGRVELDIQNELKRVLEERGEGLVIKNPDSRYVLADRRSSWIKIKPDYMDELAETLDVVIIGAFWGEGKRGGRHAAYLCGLRDDNADLVDGEPVFWTVTKVGTGFSMATFELIDKKTQGKWIEPRKDARGRILAAGLPRWFYSQGQCADLLIAPSDSVVLTVKGAEIVQSVNFGTGSTLRFPRAIAVREDKTYETSMSVTEWEWEQAQLSSGKKVGTTLTGNKKKNTEGRAALKNAMTISTPLGRIRKQSKIFDKYIFYVHFLKKPLVEKQGLEKVVAENGGLYAQRIFGPDEASHLGILIKERIVVGTDLNGTLKYRKGADQSNIVIPEWVLDSVKAGKVLPLTKQYVLQANKVLKANPVYKASLKEAGIDPSDVETDPAAYNFIDQPLKRDPLGVQIKEEEVDEQEPDTEDSDDSSGAEDHDEIREGQDLVEEEEMSRQERFPKIEIVSPVKGKGKGRAVDSMDMDLDEPTFESASSTATLPQDDAYGLTNAPPGLGAGSGAMEYDQTLIFDRFVFYLDLSTLVVPNQLTVSTSPHYVQSEADETLLEMKALLESNGGTLTENLDDPMLTHIIVVATVTTRYKEMMRRTTLPRRRKIVLFNWIKACVREGQALDERDFMA